MPQEGFADIVEPERTVRVRDPESVGDGLFQTSSQGGGERGRVSHGAIDSRKSGSGQDLPT